MARKLILIVCWGNIQRSPIVELLINTQLKIRRLDSQYVCLSRGIQGSGGCPPPRFSNFTHYTKEYEAAKRILDDLGIDLSAHQAKPVSQDIIARAKIILAMDNKIINDPDYGLIKQFPQVKDKIYLFSELVGENAELVDLDSIGDAKLHQVNILKMHQVVIKGFDRLLSLLEST